VADVFTLDRLATDSAFVVAATVGEIRSAWNADHTSIESTITLVNVERITRAGVVASPDVTYTTLGGTVGDTTLRISCVPELRTGDRWVLFLQRTFHQSPVLGMERGMFRIETVDGASRITGAGGAPVVGIDADGSILESAEAHGAPVAPRATRGSIRAVRIVERAATDPDAGAPRPAPMTPEAFLDEVRMRMPPDRAEEAGPIELTWVPSKFVPVRPKSVHEVAPAPAPEPEAAR